MKGIERAIWALVVLLYFIWREDCHQVAIEKRDAEIAELTQGMEIASAMIGRLMEQTHPECGPR